MGNGVHYGCKEDVPKMKKRKRSKEERLSLSLVWSATKDQTHHFLALALIPPPSPLNCDSSYDCV